MNHQRRRVWFLTPAFLSIGLWLWLYCVPSATVLHGAEQPKVSAPSAAIKPPPARPVVIPASEIIPRAEQTLRSLQETRFALAADSDFALNSLQNELAASAEKSDKRWQGKPEMIGELRSLQRLNDVLREWSLEQSQLDRWDRTLMRRSQILVAQETDVGQIYETWQATHEAGKQQAFPKVALEKVTEVLREADAVRGLIRDSMAKLLSLQIELANRREFLAKIRGAIDRAREESGRQLFVLDSRPLWEAIFVHQTHDVVMFQIIQSSERLAEDLREFGTKYRNRMFWHAILFVALVLLFRSLRRSSGAQTIEPMGGSALFVLDRGWSTSFLLGLISVPLFYPAATAAVWRTAALPTVVPVIRLLPRLLPTMYRHGVYWLVAIYLLNFIRYLLPAEWLVTRLLLLLIASGGCIGLGLFLRSRGKELSALGSRGWLMILALRLVCALFAVSVLSNAIGNMTLAEILLDMPVRSAYTAALTFAGAHLLTTLVGVALKSHQVMWLRSVRVHGALIALRCRHLIHFGAILFWASLSLSMMGILGDISDAALSLLKLRWKLGAAEISIQDVAMFFAVILSAAIFSRMLRFVLTEEIFPRIRLPRGVPGAVDVLCRYGVLLLGFLIALAAAGVDFSKVTLLISALGVGIGFGLQNLVNNFVSGLILVFEHPIQVSDHVEVGSLFGQVRKIGFRASILRTPDGADVIVPNSELIGSRVINWSLTDQLRRISIPVNVAYGTDPDEVRDVLLGIARNHPEVLAAPAPLVIFDRFADSALNFTLLCWSSVETWFLTRSELTSAINNAFKESGIQIPFPQQDVHIHWPRTTNAEDNAKAASDPAGGKVAEPSTFASAGIAPSKK